MAERRKRGRPSKLTPELQETIVGYIRLGNYRRAAAVAAGVTEHRFTMWMRAGKVAKSGQYFEFYKAVIEAENLAEIRMVGLVQRAATEDAKHAEWWLERKRHKYWGRKDRKEITGKGGEPLTPQLSNEETALALAALLARLGIETTGEFATRMGSRVPPAIGNGQNLVIGQVVAGPVENHAGQRIEPGPVANEPTPLQL